MDTGGKVIRDIRFTPDGGRLYCAGIDGVIRLRKSVDGRLVRRFTGSGPFAFALSSDGRRLACNGPRIYDFSVAAQRHKLSGRLEQARVALASAPDDPEAKAVVGRWYGLTGMDEWARELLTAASAGGADVPPAELAVLCWRTGRLPEAAELLRQRRPHRRRWVTRDVQWPLTPSDRCQKALDADAGRVKVVRGQSTVTAACRSMTDAQINGQVHGQAQA